MLSASTLVFFVEEMSMEFFLRAFLPAMLPVGMEYFIHPHKGKGDLLKKLGQKLNAYRKWLPADHRIIVIVDRDNDDCVDLKDRIEAIFAEAGFSSRRSSGRPNWRMASCIAIEELEAWYFGDWTAVRAAYPKASVSIPDSSSYRVPDAIQGGTWESLERVLNRSGYFRNGIRKLELAKSIGSRMSPRGNTSASFNYFVSTVSETCS